jgi:hypothetical protein
MSILGTASIKRRNRLCLESLESRYVPSTVTNLADAGPGSLRDALSTTPGGGTVDFLPGLSGTIALTSAGLTISQDVDIAGPGAGRIIVSGDHRFRVFDINPGVTATITGLTIAGGRVTNDDGGGIRNAGTLHLSETVLTGNSVVLFGITGWNLGGGGIYNSGPSANLLITDSTINVNSVMFVDSNMYQCGGGGIYNFEGELTVANSMIAGNGVSFLGVGGSDSGGGGICNSGVPAVLNVTTSTIVGNSSGGAGGGVYNGNGEEPVKATIAYSTIRYNSADVFGGGILNGSILEVYNSTIDANSNDGICSGGTLLIWNSTVCNNRTAFEGGGGILDFGVANIASCTISGNIAADPGGGIAHPPGSEGTILLENTLIAGNSSPSAADVAGPLGSLGHNLIGVGDGGSGFVDTDLVGTAADPIDPMLGPLADNGGPTQTMALLPGSPAIDAGVPTPGRWDQRGPGYDRVVNGATDIGAYEVQDGQGTGPPALAFRLPETTLPTIQTQWTRR